MSGSKSWFTYNADDGGIFAIQMDTGNAGLAGNVPAPLRTRTIPRGITPRFINYSSLDRKVVRKVYFGTAALLAAAASTVIGDFGRGSETLNAGIANGEKEKFSGPNTGLLV
jgi:hypothetical protein